MVFSEECEPFDVYYILKVLTDEGEKYFFRPNVFVKDAGLAKKFNTLRSVRRSIRVFGITHYRIERFWRKN